MHRALLQPSASTEVLMYVPALRKEKSNAHRHHSGNPWAVGRGHTPWGHLRLLQHWAMSSARHGTEGG